MYFLRLLLIVTSMSTTSATSYLKSYGISIDNTLSMIQTRTTDLFAITGTVEDYGQFDQFVGVFNITQGDFQFIRTLGGSSNSHAQSIVESQSGSFMIAGSTPSELLWTKFSSTGSFEFSFTIGTVEYKEQCNGALETSDGGAVLVGYDDSGGGVFPQRALIVKLNSTTGSLIFAKRLDVQRTMFIDAVETSEGGLVAAGRVVGASGGDILLAKFNATGSLLFVRVLSIFDIEEQAIDVIQASNGDLVVVGMVQTPSALNDAFIARFNASGTLLYTRRVGTARYDWANNVFELADNSLLVVGLTNDIDGSQNAFVAKFTGSTTSPTLVFSRQLDIANYLTYIGSITEIIVDGSIGIAGIYNTGSGSDNNVFLSLMSASVAIGNCSLWHDLSVSVPAPFTTISSPSSYNSSSITLQIVPYSPSVASLVPQDSLLCPTPPTFSPSASPSSPPTPVPPTPLTTTISPTASPTTTTMPTTTTGLPSTSSTMHSSETWTSTTTTNTTSTTVITTSSAVNLTPLDTSSDDSNSFPVGTLIAVIIIVILCIVLVVVLICFYSQNRLHRLRRRRHQPSRRVSSRINATTPSRRSRANTSSQRSSSVMVPAVPNTAKVKSETYGELQLQRKDDNNAYFNGELGFTNSSNESNQTRYSVVSMGEPIYSAPSHNAGEELYVTLPIIGQQYIGLPLTPHYDAKRLIQMNDVYRPPKQDDNGVYQYIDMAAGSDTTYTSLGEIIK